MHYCCEAGRLKLKTCCVRAKKNKSFLCYFRNRKQSSCSWTAVFEAVKMRMKVPPDLKFKQQATAARSLICLFCFMLIPTHEQRQVERYHRECRITYNIIILSGEDKGMARSGCLFYARINTDNRTDESETNGEREGESQFLNQCQRRKEFQANDSERELAVNELVKWRKHLFPNCIS